MYNQQLTPQQMWLLQQQQQQQNQQAAIMAQQAAIMAQQAGGYPANTAAMAGFGGVNQIGGNVLPSQVVQQQTSYAGMMTGQQPQQAQTVPGGAPYPQFFEPYTSIPVNTAEQALQQTLSRELHTFFGGAGCRVFQNEITANGINPTFVSEVATMARRIMQLLILNKQVNTLVEACNLAVSTVIYGRMVDQLGGIDSPEISGYEMMTGKNLKTLYPTWNQINKNPRVYTDVLTTHMQKFNETIGAVQRQQLQAPTAPMLQGNTIGNIAINTGMVDPLDLAANELYEQRAIDQQNQQMAEIAKQIRPAQDASIDYVIQHNTSTGDSAPMTNVIPTPKSEADIVDLPKPAIFSNGDEMWEWEDRNTAYRQQQMALLNASRVQQQPAQPQQVVEKQVVQQQVVEHVIQPQQSEYVIPQAEQPQQAAPIHQPSHVQQPVRSTVQNMAGHLFDMADSSGAAIKTTPNGRVLPNMATHQHQNVEQVEPVEPVSSYYSMGGSPEFSSGPETLSDGQLVIEPQVTTDPLLENEIVGDDAFAAMVYEREAEDAAAIEQLNQAHGNPQSTQDLISRAREMGIAVSEPKLEIDFLSVDVKARRKIARDNRVRVIPAYLIGRHNLKMVTTDNKTEVKLEEVTEVDYLKHELEFHNQRPYDSWDADTDKERKFKEHLAAATNNVWSEEKFVEKLNEKLANISNASEADSVLEETLAERPLIEIDGYLSNSTAANEFTSTVLNELAERGVESPATVSEAAIIRFTRFNTSRIIISEADRALFTKLRKQKSAADVAESLKEIKSNTGTPVREVARLFKEFDKQVNARLKIIFSNGWNVVSAVDDLDELIAALVDFYPDLTRSVIEYRLARIYTEARNDSFLVMETDTAEEPEHILGAVEDVVLLPFYYSAFPLAKSEDVAAITEENYPELAKFLTTCLGSPSAMTSTTIRLVTLDSVSMTFIPDFNGTFFLTEVE